MKHDVKIPRVGESVQEAMLSQWYKRSGDLVHKDEPLLLIETDKVTLEITAEVDGRLEITVGNEQTVAVDSVVGVIDTDAAPVIKKPAASAAQEILPASEKETGKTNSAAEEKTPPSIPVQAAGLLNSSKTDRFDFARPPIARSSSEVEMTTSVEKPATVLEVVSLPPSVRRLAAEHDIDLSQIQGTGPGGRITKSDVVLHLEKTSGAQPQPESSETLPSQSRQPESDEPITRKPMSPIRKRIAAHLLESRHNTAMLTTFNDIDMSRVIELRTRYKDLFQKKYQVKLGFMSFFVKACVEALKGVPQLNAFIEGDDLVYHHYYHIGVAVGSERGLVVPVIRHADQLGFAEIEQAIQQYVEKINANRLELSDLEGGTFTITNGGVFGSLLSTPILNTPQSGILGMHKIDKRPVVVEDEIVIRPMMYVALSYDHRIVDGRESVMFLNRVKECIEHPERLVLEV
ncbi:2-oxoglutarate dehydrogenase E2 component [Candidatus Vecturithrix granuli]|uniref:Dihydrolipoyllysine-residue succinyltransferase component of 2-oxoglutarate dehydrogenase complex n=1 Tax=Vecturithrix granuli TaxID=1499967 RepID=A0A081C3J9_VECG1|nr:2-oxoglutarate dehydrogenase E2 component [Candidatus Vecturithrix granuli]